MSVRTLRFTSLCVSDPDQLVFGRAPEPVDVRPLDIARSSTGLGALQATAVYVDTYIKTGHASFIRVREALCDPGWTNLSVTSAEDEMTGRRLLPFLTIAVVVIVPHCGGRDGPSLPDPIPFEPEVMAKVHEIRDLAAEVRQLEPNEEISKGTVSREVLTAYYEEFEAMMSEEEELEVEAFNIAWRLLHLIGPEDDLQDLFAGMMSSQTAGLYSMEEDRLYLVGENEVDLGPEDEFVLAHEYVHSFQDAAFDFDRLDEMTEEEREEKRNTEYGETIAALIEGDATTAAIGYYDEKIGPAHLVDWVYDPTEGCPATDEQYPPALKRYFYFPYSEALFFVLYLLDKGGWEEVNKAYADPPSTTEQILHPVKYFQRELAYALALPDLSDTLGEGWQQIEDDVFGEFDVYNYLLTALEDDSTASGAAEGWGGGRIAIYANEEEEGRALVHLVTTWDTIEDTFEFQLTYKILIDYLSDGEYSSVGDEYYYALMWDGEGEHVRAWAEGREFTILVGTDRDDVVSVLTAMDPEAAEKFRGGDAEAGPSP